MIGKRTHTHNIYLGGIFVGLVIFVVVENPLVNGVGGADATTNRRNRLPGRQRLRNLLRHLTGYFRFLTMRGEVVSDSVGVRACVRACVLV